MRNPFIKKTNNNKSKAFTLVEMLIAMSIMSLIMLVVSNLLMMTLRVNYKVDARRKVVQDLEVVLKVIQRDIKSSREVVSPVGGSSGDTLEFVSVDGITHVYALGGQNIRKDKTIINSSKTKIEDLEFFVEEIGASQGTKNWVVSIKIEAVPRQGYSSDDITVIKQAVAYTEAYETGF
jgi:prepilin-type N-terminal cleavage/methylation domain-containing protein